MQIHKHVQTVITIAHSTHYLFYFIFISLIFSFPSHINYFGLIEIED